MTLSDRVLELTKKCKALHDRQGTIAGARNAEDAATEFETILEDWRPILGAAEAMHGKGLVESPYPDQAGGVAEELRNLSESIKGDPGAAKDKAQLLSRLKALRESHASSLGEAWRAHCIDQMPVLLGAATLDRLSEAFPGVGDSLRRAQDELATRSHALLPASEDIEAFHKGLESWQQSLEAAGIDEPEIKDAFERLVQGVLLYSEVDGSFKAWLEAKEILDQCRVRL